MFQQKRRAKREAADLPVQLVLYNSEDDVILSGPAPSFIYDISYYGAGLLLKKVFFPPHHLFYAPRDNETMVLCLEKRDTPEGDLIVPVKPVCLRLDDDGDAAGLFRMGVEFMTDPEDHEVIALEKMALASRASDKNLLRKLVKIFH
jgi:hypothetical protein